MKKIVSLMCVIAMLFAFAVTVSAAGTSFDITQKSLTATEAVYDVTITSDYAMYGVNAYLDVTDAIDKGVTVTVKKESATTARYVSNKNMIIVQFAPSSGTPLDPGTTTLATITFNMTNVTESFAIDKVAETTQTTTMFKYKDLETTEIVDITADVAYNYNVTVVPYQAPAQDETVELTPVAAADTLTVDGVKYTNVAIMPVNFALESGKTAKALSLDILKNGVSVVEKALDVNIAGAGSVDFVVAIYGITDGATFTAVPSITYGN